MSGTNRKALTHPPIMRKCAHCGKTFETTADSPWARKLRGEWGEKRGYFCGEECFKASYKHKGWSNAKTGEEKPPKPERRKKPVFWLDEAIELYEGGMSITLVAARYGISTKTVWARFRAAGVKMRWGNGRANVTGKSEANICFDCEKACGRCPWSKNFTPVPGWTAEPVKTVHKTGGVIETYKITACPLFEQTPPRKGCQGMLTEEQNEEFLKFGEVDL